jgi:hypothetical protein
MTTREKAPTILTAEGARRLTDRLVTTLTEAHELLIDLWVGRAWEVLDYPNWAAYCEAELGDLLMVKLPPAMRREAAAHMKSAGMSYRNISAPFGVSPASIHADLAPAKPKSVQKLNTPATPPPVVHLSNVDRAVALVAAQGTRGLTYIELCREAGWRGGQATGALSEAKRRGLVAPSGQFRDHCTVYLRP